jgi:hypothetical protein
MSAVWFCSLRDTNAVAPERKVLGEIHHSHTAAAQEDRETIMTYRLAQTDVASAPFEWGIAVGISTQSMRRTDRPSLGLPSAGIMSVRKT